jgi:Ca2+-binding RTX toxin-like protein
MRRPILRTGVALVGLLGTMGAPAGATASCVFDSGSQLLTVTGTRDGVRLTVVRDGQDIVVRDGPTEIGCGGSPTVTNTDLIRLVDATSSGDLTVTVSLAQGPFAPGQDPEGGRAEIEFEAEWPPGSLDQRLRILGRPSADTIEAGGFGHGGSGMRLNDDGDIDMHMGNVDLLTVSGLGGSDLLSGGGGPGFDLPYFAPLALRGGARPDVLEAGLAGNRLLGQGGRDVISGGEGKDVGNGGPGDDEVRGGPGRDRLKGAGGDDRVIGNARSDILTGGPGDDRLNGGPGRDRCAGGPGTDVLRSCEVP